MPTSRDMTRHLDRYTNEPIIPIEIPEERPSDDGSNASTASALSLALERLRTNYDLTFQQIAEELSTELGGQVKYPTVYAWMTRGIHPRTFSEAELHEAIAAIEARHDYMEEGIWVDSNEVSDQIHEWMKTFTSEQIAAVSDIPSPTIRAWACGNHRVRRPRWEQLQASVEEALEAWNTPDREPPDAT